MHLRVVNYAALLQLFYMLFRYTVYAVIILYNGKHKTFPQWMDNNYWRKRQVSEVNVPSVNGL